MTEFDGKIAIITGAGGALGSTVAKQFAEKGATTIMVDINREAIKSAQQHIEGTTDAMVCDLTDENAVSELVTEIVSKYNTIDILANIAGGFTMGGKTHETELSTLEKMLDFNTRTMFLLSKHVLKVMQENQSGKIINIGARAGLEGSPQMGPYVGSKAMVIRLTETMAKEYRDDNININCILPGTIDTEQNRQDMPDANHDSWVAPKDLGTVIQFLASEKAIAIKGAAIPVYGNTL